MKSNVRLCLTLDGRLVEDSHEDADTLIAAEGHEVPAEYWDAYTAIYGEGDQAEGAQPSLRIEVGELGALEKDRDAWAFQQADGKRVALKRMGKADLTAILSAAGVEFDGSVEEVKARIIEWAEAEAEADEGGE